MRIEKYYKEKQGIKNFMLEQQLLSSNSIRNAAKPHKDWDF